MNPNQSIDSSNMHKSIYDFPGQMSEAISIGKKIKLINDYRSFLNFDKTKFKFILRELIA